MKRGRKPKNHHPSDPHYRPTRHNDGSTAAAYEGRPEMPESVVLDQVALEMWDHCIATLPGCIVSAADGPALASLCQWWSTYLTLASRYAEDPADAALGRQVKSAHSEYLALADRFGMSPKTRQRFKVADKQDEGEDPMARALGVVS